MGAIIFYWIEKNVVKKKVFLGVITPKYLGAIPPNIWDIEIKNGDPKNGPPKKQENGNKNQLKINPSKLK